MANALDEHQFLVYDFLGKNTVVGLPFPSPGDLPDPRIKSMSPALSGRFFTTEPPRKLSALFLTPACESVIFSVRS